MANPILIPIYNQKTYYLSFINVFKTKQVKLEKLPDYVLRILELTESFFI
jgi:hypothetical protein